MRGDEDIGIAVVVVIGCIRAGSPIRIEKTGRRRHVFKATIAQIMKQVNVSGMRRYPGRFIAGRASQLVHRSAIHEQEVHPAIVIVIEPSHAAAIRFRNPALLRSTALHRRVHAGGFSHIGEAQCWRGR